MTILNRLTSVSLFAVALVLVVGTGCDKPPEGGPEKAAAAVPPVGKQHDLREIAAKVDDVTLTWEEMEHRAKGFYIDESRTTLIPAGREEEAMDFFRRRAINVFVFKTIMLQEAEKQKITLVAEDYVEGTNRMNRALKSRGIDVERLMRDSPFGEEMARQEFVDGMIVDKLLKLQVQDRITVEGAEVDKLAEEIIANRVEQRKKANALRQQLLGGADFATLAAANSDDASKKNGGDLGQFARGRMIKPFDEAAFSQAVGAIGPVVETPFGFHIIKVTSHNPAQAAGKDTPEVPETVQASHILIKARPVLTRRELMDEVRRTKYNEAVKAYYAGLKRGRKIDSVYKDLVL